MAWYAQWFSDELYEELYSHRDVAEARLAVALFTRITCLPPAGSRILDLACGTGRHSFEFARLGYRTVATDLSAQLLTVAKRRTQKYGASLALVRGDMRHLPFAAGFDGVVQLFTAFGYFGADAANEAVIGEVSRVLTPGGWYMLDFLNADAIRRTLVPFTDERIGDRRVTQKRWLEGGRVEKRITVHLDGGTSEYRESVRLFTRDDLRQMLQRQGFEVRETLGSYDGEAFQTSSPRCILFSTLRA